MTERSIIDEDRIQDYIDDRLGDRDRASVAAYLLAHPEIGADVEKLRRQNEALKAIGQEILDEPVPERLYDTLHRTETPSRPAIPVPMLSRNPFLEAAAAILLFVVGGAVGWLLHDQLEPPLSEDDLLTSQIVYAHDFYARESDYPIDFAADRVDAFEGWINRAFERSLPPPDLGKFKFSYTGARRMPTARTPVGNFQFENDRQERLGVFFWRTATGTSPLPRATLDDRTAVKIWIEGDLNLAVVGDRSNPDFDVIADDISVFYHEVFAAH